jgi:signal transduction histidine kinase
LYSTSRAGSGYWDLSTDPRVRAPCEKGTIVLHMFITDHRDEILARCEAKVGSRLPTRASVADPDGIPLFLEQLVDTLRQGTSSNPGIGESAGAHGRRLRVKGFTVSQVVHDYGDVCQSITELAVELNAPIAAYDFRTMNQCLDDAIASAVTEYGREREEVADVAATREAERWAVVTHELRNLVNTALMAFDVLRAGSVGMGGSTAGVLYRSLTGLQALVNQSLAGVRMTQGVQRHERIMVPEFMREIESTATLSARSRGIRFAVERSEDDIAIGGDRQVLAAVMMNLLQNAFKFTRAGSTVTLRTGMRADRVFFEVEDECGGLSGANPDELFRPFEQRSLDRTGLGLGLTFCRWGAEANNGQVHARSLADKGCIFTLDLPRLLMPAGVS